MKNAIESETIHNIRAVISIRFRRGTEPKTYAVTFRFHRYSGTSFNI